MLTKLTKSHSIQLYITFQLLHWIMLVSALTSVYCPKSNALLNPLQPTDTNSCVLQSAGNTVAWLVYDVTNDVIMSRRGQRWCQRCSQPWRQWVADYVTATSSVGRATPTAARASLSASAPWLHTHTGQSIISKVGNCTALRPRPQFVPGPPFISWTHVSIAGSQFINNRLNVWSMTSWCFFFQFCCKSIQHCEIYDRKNVKFKWLLNYRITIPEVAKLLAQERRFRLWNPIILQPERSRLKFPLTTSRHYYVVCYVID